jgi:O-acetylhomoserine (thiol)-lyase
VQYLRNVGPAIAPFNAFLLAQGLETLSLRMERHIANTRKVAEWLQAREDVSKVTWASLPGSDYKELADKYTPKGSGAVLTFELPGGVDAGRKFIDSLELFSHVANIGDVRSLAIHPASTTHSQGTPEEHAAAGVTPGLVRLAVGLEHIDDILADLDTGLRAAK